jgi:hypothetical protein
MPIYIDDRKEIAEKKAAIQADEVRLEGLKAKHNRLYTSFTGCCEGEFRRHRECMRNEEEHLGITLDIDDLEKQIAGGEGEVQQLERELSEDEIQQSWAAGAVVGSAFLILILLALSVPMRMYMDGPATVENKVETAVRGIWK